MPLCCHGNAHLGRRKLIVDMPVHVIIQSGLTKRGEGREERGRRRGEGIVYL